MDLLMQLTVVVPQQELEACSTPRCTFALMNKYIQVCAQKIAKEWCHRDLLPPLQIFVTVAQNVVPNHKAPSKCLCTLA